MSALGPSPWKLSPSDFGFLWEECKRCFYLKVARGYRRPPGIFPAIFRVIDGCMREYYAGQLTGALDASLPPGTVDTSERSVVSAPLELPGSRAAIVINGKLDALLRFDDGAYGVADFKTAGIHDENGRRYARQLHAYAHALENPAAALPLMAPVTRLGLFVFEPTTFARGQSGRVGLAGDASWFEVPRETSGFRSFLEEVAALLSSPDAPPMRTDCAWCRYRRESWGDRL
jgi:hypothetical protein